MLLGAGILLVVSVAVVYAGTFLQARVALPGCSRSLDTDGSTSRAGHASMQWVPPAARCSYPRNDLFGVPADQETHFAFFGVTLLGLLAAGCLYGALLSGWAFRVTA